jgi:hypothetical protein
MYVSKVRELVDVVVVDLQLLSTHCIPWSAVCTARLGGLCAARTERVEELVLSFVWMRGEARSWSPVFLLQVVPLPLSALPFHLD